MYEEREEKKNLTHKMIKYKNEEEHVRHIHRQKQQREREKKWNSFFFVEDNEKENSEIQLDIFFVRVLMLF